MDPTTPDVNPFVEMALNYYKQYPMVGILLLLMVMDVISGMIAAVIQGRLSSKMSFPGMMKKASILLIVGLGAVLEKVQPDIPLAKLVAGFFVIHESLSILENARRAGVPIPPILQKSLDVIGRGEPIPVTPAAKEHTTVTIAEAKEVKVETQTDIPKDEPKPSDTKPC